MIPRPPEACRAAIVEFDRYETVDEPQEIMGDPKSVKFMLGDAYSKAVGLVPSEEEEDDEDQEEQAAPPAPAPSQLIGNVPQV